MNSRRVVVTGLGLISPVGNSVAEGWKNLLAGRTGIANITKFDATHFTTRFASVCVRCGLTSVHQTLSILPRA